MAESEDRKNIIDRLVGPGVPWQFRLLLCMVVLFFCGGLFLDWLATRVDLAAPTDDQAASTTAAVIEHLNGSARLVYDFAKVALGALIASVHGVLRITREEKDGSVAVIHRAA